MKSKGYTISKDDNFNLFGSTFHLTDSTNYFIQADTTAVSKPRSKSVIKPWLLTVSKNSKIIIAKGSSLNLGSVSFNGGLSFVNPARSGIVCQGTGKLNIRCSHFSAHGWRLRTNPFIADTDLKEVANGIELIVSDGTSEGFQIPTLMPQLIGMTSARLILRPLSIRNGRLLHLGYPWGIVNFVKP